MKIKKINLQIFVLIFLELLLICYVYYKDFIHWNSELKTIYIKYYFIIGFALFFTISILFFSKKLKTYILISLYSFLISVYLAETTLIFFNPKDPKDYDKRTKFEIYKELKNKGVDIVPTFDQRYFLNNKKGTVHFGGVSNQYTIFCNETGEFSFYESDRYGFNNPDEVWDSKEVDFLLLGDSFIHGACVNENENIGHYIRDITKKNVISLGYVGWGPLTQLAVLKEFTKNKKIKNILWFYYEADLLDLIDEIKYDFLQNYYNPIFSQDLINKIEDRDNQINNVINKLSDELSKNKLNQFYIEELSKNENISVRFTLDASKIDKYNFIKFIKLTNIRKYFRFDFFFLKNFDIEEDVFKEYSKILKIVKNYADDNDTKLSVIFIPNSARFLPKLFYDPGEFWYRDRVINIINSNNVHFVDFYNEIKKSGNPKKFYPFGLKIHFTPDGYKKLSQFVINEIN